MSLYGWCDTEIGYQIIVECPCGCKFRFHAGNWYKFDKEEFIKEVEAQFIFIKNQSEIGDKLTEFNKLHKKGKKIKKGEQKKNEVFGFYYYHGFLGRLFLKIFDFKNQGEGVARFEI